MARIAGVDLPRDKRVEIGLTYIYGIGRKTSSITAALMVTFAVTSLMILKDLLILVVTVAFATEKDFL